MTDALDQLHDFDVQHATVNLWAFKRSGSVAAGPIYRGRWIGTSPILEAALKDALEEARQAITETFEYGLLAQNNEASALAISTEETYAGLIVSQASDATQANKIKKVAHIANAEFYAVKLTTKSGSLFAVRKTDKS